MSENVRFWGTIVLFRIEKVFCESLFAFVVRKQFVCVAWEWMWVWERKLPLRVSALSVSIRALLVGSCVNVCSDVYDPWSRTTLLIVSPILPTITLCPSFLPSQSIPLCVHLWPLTNHSGQMLFCAAVSQSEGMTSSFPHLTIALLLTHTHCSRSGRI